MRFKTRKPWRNAERTLSAQPLRQYWPADLAELREIVGQAGRDGVPVRAVGSGHSWSDVAVTTGYLIRPEKLNRVLDLELDVLREGIDADRLFRVESGVRLRELNDILWGHGLGLANMGGFDGQTLVGATATSTHGSGLAFGPLSDFLVSIDLVAADATVYRVERRDGPTDRVRFQRKHPDCTLVQDDDWFNAVAVGLGSIGVIHSVIFRVVPRFFLKEVRTLSTWPEVKAQLRAGMVLRENEHYEVLINPYAVGGRHRCLITTRHRTGDIGGLPWSRLRRRLLTELLASLPHIDFVLGLIFDELPPLSPWLIDVAMAGLVEDGFSGRSYRVLNIGMANDIPAISAELAFPMEDGVYIEAVQRVLELAEHHARLGQIYHTAPVSLRFVKGTDLFLSPQQGADAAMLELIMVRGTHGALEMLYEYEMASYRYRGRPHWGQVNFLTGSHDRIRSLYPRYDDWLAVHGRLNEGGRFDSPFTTRVGFGRQPVPARNGRGAVPTAAPGA